MASCYHPLKAYDFGINPDTGKHIIRVTKGEYSPQEASVEGVKIIPIPCGKCIGCRLQYSRVWADRCMAEASMYKDNIFLTLTYNDENLPKPNRLDNGRLSPVHPLVKRDLQLFIKRLRKALPDQRIRYFACGEYGPKNLRPHYHLIIFNCRLEDIKLLYKNENQFSYYTSDTVGKCWKYGFHIISDVNWHTCAYTARYIVKKQKGNNAKVYEEFKYPPEFTLMSLKPGIGREYFDNNAINIYYGGSFIPTEEGALRIYPNKYYDKLFDIEYPDCSVVLNEEKERIIKNNELMRSSLTDLSYRDMLLSEEEYKKARTKILKRKEM